jgi:hypothetical protein
MNICLSTTHSLLLFNVKLLQLNGLAFVWSVFEF